MPDRRGVILLLVLLLFLLGLRYGRGFFHEEGPPAFCVSRTGGIPVMLGAGFPVRGIHQFSDGTRPQGVIQMTISPGTEKRIKMTSNNRPLFPGECLELHEVDGEALEVERKFLSAGKRITLGIPLRVQTMSGQDWAALPGVGPCLAERIEADRQRNGGFGSLQGLKRVPGVGEGRLRAWKKLFSSNQ